MRKSRQSGICAKKEETLVVFSSLHPRSRCYPCIVYPLLNPWLKNSLDKADRLAYGDDQPHRIDDDGRELPRITEYMEETMQTQSQKNIEITVVLPDSFEHQAALARVDLLDNSPGAKPFTVIRTEQIVMCKCTDRFHVPFRNVPHASAYAVYVHILVNRKQYATKDCFVDIRPGDCMTPLPWSLTLEEGNDPIRQDIRLTEIIEHAPFVGHAG
jgi:hypothetical protein